ncbi:phenylacetic acid degradation protein [Phyllobacterium phragmitis]|uniref:Phenylacetic acid degradation protein n=1 Tax=Phyllobacterium phragmitis TaxID=2670329 RepID=A0A2S9IN21_9HYPH|nr:PaaI family thioesterase [Phyllobacterium phragmitis]PRD41929.1 phenylacetic acid degradation protein [Phyllobacterium phragmitis]
MDHSSHHTFKPVMTADEINGFIEREFPQVNAGSQDGRAAYSITAIGDGTASMRLDADKRHLRPGGTVSGPTLFALADITAYVAILAHIGPVALAVTTNLNINFLRKPSSGRIDAVCRILKLGKRLAIVEISMTSEADGELVAHATATYSIPPRTA